MSTEHKLLVIASRVIIWLSLCLPVIAESVELKDLKIDLCVMRCKDNHMREMENEWSTDFTLPLLNLLRATGNETAAYLKAREICSSNFLLSECLHKCNRSQEVQILLIGVRSWQDACENLDEVRAQFTCWKENGEALSSACRLQTIRLKQTMQEFASNQSHTNIQNICSDFDKFSTCFTAEHGRLCGIRSEMITGRMFHSNREAMFNMLKIRWATLPSSCGFSQLRRDTYSAERFALVRAMKRISSMRRRIASAATVTPSQLQCPIHHASTSGETLKIRPFAEIPGPRELPIFGNSHNIFNTEKKIENYFNYLTELHVKYGKLVKENLGAGKGYVVHVYDPEDSRTVFQADGKTPHIIPLQETTQQYRKMRGMNPGLGNLNGDEWYRLRSSVNQLMMRPQAVQAYLPFVNQVAESLTSHIKSETAKDGQVDMRRVSGRWSLEAAGNSVFEKRLGALGDNVNWADMLVDVNKQIFQLSAKMKFGFPFYRYFSTPRWKKMIELEDIFYREADKLMDEAIDKLQSKENEESLLFASCLINKPELNKRDIKVILLSLFADGLSTTAPMLVYNVFNIASHADIQEQLRHEINGIIKKDQLIEAAHLQKMPMLRACIKETFRLYPIGTEISRIPSKDLILSGYHVPAGTPVDINTNVLMKSPKFFTDPLIFKPERWLRENENKEQSHPFAFLPFGFGPRMCAGRRFAEQDLQVALAKLVQGFEITHKHSPITQTYETLLLPKGNCRFEMKPI